MRKDQKQLPQVVVEDEQLSVRTADDLGIPIVHAEHASAGVSAFQDDHPLAPLLPLSPLTYVDDLMDRNPAAVLAVDDLFRVRDLNQAATQKLHFTRDQASTQSCRDVLNCRNFNHTRLCGTSNCPLTRVLQDNKAIAADELLLGATTASEYSASIVPVNLDGRPGAVFIARDLSTLKVANQVRANFVSMVSHELRTPLNSVHGFIDLLMQGHMGELQEEQKKYLGFAQEGVQQLMTIVEDILLMTRSDSGQFEMKSQKLNTRVLAKQVVTGVKFQQQKAAVIIEKDIPENAPLLYADPQRMKQVLLNLVTNAIKFTPPYGVVTIRFREISPTMVRCEVIDTGYGIPLEDQPHVFERFYQSNHALQSKMGGYGLGLSIARLIVEQHGGTISFTSVPDKGTTFSFTAPLYIGQDEAVY